MNNMTPSLDMRYPEQHCNGQLSASIPYTKHEHYRRHEHCYAIIYRIHYIECRTGLSYY
jgi:hypothetical protein